MLMNKLSWVAALQYVLQEDVGNETVLLIENWLVKQSRPMLFGHVLKRLCVWALGTCADRWVISVLDDKVLQYLSRHVFLGFF